MTGSEFFEVDDIYIFFKRSKTQTQIYNETTSSSNRSMLFIHT